MYTWKVCPHIDQTSFPKEKESNGLLKIYILEEETKRLIFSYTQNFFFLNGKKSFL